MAEGRDSNYLSPLEEQYIQEAEADGDLDQQLLRERELASQKLWLAFQDSATAVAHLFRGILDRPISSMTAWKARDCQQQAGLSAWVPFHESASAVTQLYKGSSEVCRQCMECGVKYGQRKKTRDLIAWAKKKRRHIKREELLAFLLDKPYPDPSSTDRVEDFADLAVSHQRPLAPTTVSGLNCLQGPCYSSNSLPSPRRRALFRDDSCVLSDSELFGVGRKRPSSSTSIPFEFGSDTPMVKRMRL